MPTSDPAFKLLDVDADTEIAFADDPSGNTIGLSWVEVYHVDDEGEDQVFVHAPTDLNDKAVYYGGYKEPRVIGWGEVTRALSDARGQYEASEFSWVVSDTDRLLRGWLSNAFQKFVQNRQVVIRMIDDASRRLMMRPRALARGLIRAFKPRGPLHFEFRARDFTSQLFGTGSGQLMIPQEKVSRADFATCPTNVVNMPVPIIFGQIGDGVSAEAPPVLTGDPARGAFLEGNWVLGFADSLSAADPVTSPSCSAASGGTLSPGEWGVAIVAVDGSGVESDPLPFFTDVPGFVSTFPPGVQPTAVVDGTQKLTVSWTASSGADKYRVYFGRYYYGFRADRYVEVSDPTTTVDILSDLDGQPTPFQFFADYAVSAVCPDGETGLSSIGFGITRINRRGLRLEWLPVAAATDYKIYRRPNIGSTWDHVRTISAPATFFEDDLLETGWTIITGAAQLEGGVGVTPVGMEADDFGFQWYAFMVCGHQVDEIGQLFQGGVLVDPGTYGVDILVPGGAGYSSFFAGHAGSPQYLERNGKIFTMIYARGPRGLAAADGSQPFTLNVVGRRDAIDGDPIVQLAQIYKDFVKNWGFQNCKGQHLDAPLWPEDIDENQAPQIDEDSFDALEAVHQSRLVGGYPGGIVFGARGEFVTQRDALARLNLSNGCDNGFNRNNSFFVTTFDSDPEGDQLAAALPYTQLNDIVKESFDLEPEVDLVENIVVYSFRRNYGLSGGRPDWDVTAEELPDEDSIDDLREERRSQVVELWGVRNGTVAADLMQRRLRYYKDPPKLVTVLTNLRGLSTELGDIILVRHIEGTWPEGQLRRLRVLRHVTNPQKYSVKFVAVDVDALYDEP